MARKERNSVDYFPHNINHGKKMFFIRNKYKNDGYATWFILLEKLGASEYHFLDLKEEIELMYLSSEIMIDKDLLNNIINDLVQIGEFDKELWENEKILFNEKFIENIQDAYKKRNNNCINKNSLITLLQSKGRSLCLKSTPKQPKSKLSVPDKPQSIVKETKEDETKEYNIHTSFAHLKITFDEYNKLLILGYTENEIKFIFEKIENYKRNTNYKSLYLTAKNWLKEEKEKSSAKKENEPIVAGRQTLSTIQSNSDWSMIENPYAKK